MGHISQFGELGFHSGLHSCSLAEARNSHSGKDKPFCDLMMPQPSIENKHSVIINLVNPGSGHSFMNKAKVWTK